MVQCVGINCWWQGDTFTLERERERERDREAQRFISASHYFVTRTNLSGLLVRVPHPCRTGETVEFDRHSYKRFPNWICGRSHRARRPGSASSRSIPWASSSPKSPEWRCVNDR